MGDFNPWDFLSPEERLAAERHMMAQMPANQWGEIPMDDPRHPLAVDTPNMQQNQYEQMMQGMEGGIQENVVNPMTEAGYPNLGAGIGAAGMAGAEMLTPGPNEGLPFMGMAGKIPKVVDLNAFRKTGKVQGRKGRPPKQEKFESDWDSDIKPALPEIGTEKPIEALKRRSMGQKREKEFKALERWETELADEPYMGGFSSTSWGDKSQFYQLPIPAANVNVKGHLGKGVSKGGIDPFAWTDSKYGNTKEVLRANAGNPLEISTRSDLIGHDDYMDLLPNNSKINMHISSDNSRVTGSVLEPGAPSFKRRLKAAEKLLMDGRDVTLVVDRFDNLSPEYGVNMFSDEIKNWIKIGGKVRENKAGKLPAKMVNEIRELMKKGDD